MFSLPLLFFAQDPTLQDLRTVALQAEDPRLALACAPLGPALDWAKRVEMPLANMLATQPEIGQWMDQLTSSEARALLDPEGQLELYSSKSEGLSLLLPTLPSAEQELLRLWFPEADVQPGAALVELQGGGTVTRARVEPQRLVLQSQNSPANPTQWAPLEGLKEVQGCVLYFSESSPSNGAPSGLALYMDPVTSTWNGQLLMSEPVGEGWETSDRPLLGVGPATPQLVLQLAADPLALATTGTGPFAMAPTTQRLREVRELVSIPRGLSLAVYTMQPSPSIAARISLGTPKGHKMSVRRARKVLEAVGAPVSFTSKRDFTLNMGVPMVGHLRWGELDIATDPALLESLASGEGQPWLSPEQEERAERYAMSVVMAPEFQLGVGGEGDRIFFSMVSPPGWVAANPTGLQLRNLAFGNFREMSQKAQETGEISLKAEETEVINTIDSIVSVELAYGVAFDHYVPLPPMPRAPEALNQNAVPWHSEPSWELLPWRSESPLQGVYWVEVSEGHGSFTVYCVIDSDGDGVPARYRKVVTQREPQYAPVEQLTPPDVR